MFDESTDMSVIRPRIERIRAWLEAKNLGALFVYSPAAEHKWGQTAHVAYLTGWANHDRIVDSAVVVPVEGDPVLMFAGLPYMLEQIEQVSPITDVRLVKAVDPNAVAMDTKTMGGARAPGTFAEEAVAIMRENEIFNERVGVVGVDNMPVPFYEHLHAELGDNLVRGDDIVAELRAVKTPEELELIRHAARLGDIGFQTMVDVARPGMRGIEIVAEMEHAVRKAGADHAKYWMGSGPDTKWEDTRLDIRPHLRVLQEGDFMNTCSYIVYKGYWSHGQRAGTLMRRNAYLEDIMQTAIDSQTAGIEQMRPGNRAGNIAKAIRETCEAAGWSLLGRTCRTRHRDGLQRASKSRREQRRDT